MLSRICLCFVFFCFSLNVGTAQPVKRYKLLTLKRDSLLTILKINDPNLQKKKLVLFLRYYFGDMPQDSINTAKAETNQLLQNYNVSDRIALGYFIETVCQVRLTHYKEAESNLVKAIDLADKNDDDYLLYACFTHLGFMQSYQGNTIGAISSFREAKKEAAELNDAYLQILIDVNISDIYYKNNLYSQALFYLNQAQSLIIVHRITESLLKNAINNNKAEIYFRMGKVDSLKKYSQILNDTKIGTYRLHIFRKRTNYYLDLLNHDYQKAIGKIRALRKDSLFQFDNTDEQNLADAYFKAGNPDSAKTIIDSLLAGDAQSNHPEIKLHLYEVLGQIAENKNDNLQAAGNYKMALQQAKDQIGRLTRVDTISSQIKIDEMQGAYIQKVEGYKRQRLLLISAMIITVLALIIGTLSYRNIKRKKHYEKLLFNAKKAELSFINSHEVRRHLSNILGIIDTLKHSDDKHQEYLEAEEHLLNAAENLDTAIKNISDKLNDDTEPT